jgi:hypothetical protein
MHQSRLFFIAVSMMPRFFNTKENHPFAINAAANERVVRANYGPFVSFGPNGLT